MFESLLTLKLSMRHLNKTVKRQFLDILIMKTQVYSYRIWRVTV